MVDIKQKITHNTKEIRAMAEEIVVTAIEIDRQAEEIGDIIKFKEDRQRTEFESGKLDIRLKIITFALAGYLYHKYKYVLTITDIYREQAEQDDIYKDNPDYKKKPWNSTHQYWRAEDIRTVDMLEVIKRDTLWFLNHFIYTGGHDTKIDHDVGRGEHIHLQVDNDDITSISKKGEV